MGAPEMKPLADTLRVVDWEELPAKVRDIPVGFNPLAEGVLMRHQAKWCAIRARIKVAKKGRRTGITFAEALDDTILSASRKTAGGDNVFYIGDTKEKGLEFIGYCAKFARVIAEAQAQGVSQIEEFLFQDQDEQGNTRQILAYRIRFASGFRIEALSSRPANIRGLQGKVVIDEAAFHPDVAGVIDAAVALLIWGGNIVVISTLNGKKNPFWQFILDVEKGLYGDDAVVFTATFDDAVANGLYERVCLMKGWTPTVEGKKKWYEGIRKGYGPRKAAMREELDAIPRDGNGVCLPGVWIDRAMREERPILRLVCDDDFARKPEGDRKAWGQEWIDRHLRPILRTLDPTLRHVAGMDYARHRHFSAITPLAIQQNLTRHMPFGIELHNVPTRQQEQIWWALIEGLPRRAGVGIDATGPGQTLAEYTADRYGVTQVHQIVLNRAWYGLWMPKLIQLFEDATIDLPRDAGIEQDLRAIEEIDGIPMIPKLEAADVKDPELVRHGDYAIALALANYVATNPAAPIEFQSAGPRSTGRNSFADYLLG